MNTPKPRPPPSAAGTAARQVVANPFGSDPVARRYARARPYYHRVALDLAARQLGISRARLAVDVGCGTGLSTRAVLELAERVIAIDTSAATLRAARPQSRARYLLAAAEQIPVRDAVADLANIGAAFHWFGQARAFAELARVLRAGLAVYSDFFLGQLTGQPAFTTWLNDAYLPPVPGTITPRPLRPGRRAARRLQRCQLRRRRHPHSADPQRAGRLPAHPEQRRHRH